MTTRSTPSEVKQGLTIVAVPVESFEKLAKLSAEKGISVSQLFVNAIDRYILELQKGK